MTENSIAARDPLGRTSPAGFTAEFAPLGISLRLETNSLAILEACRASFGRYGLPQTGRRTARFLIRLLVDPAFTETTPWPEPVFRGQGDLFYVCVGRQNTAVADLKRRLALGFVAPAMAEDEGQVRRTFLECLTFTMATQGTGATRTYVHASAVAKGDRGVLFSGPRESGKSTLAYACARRGFHVVTDDVIYLEHGRDSLTAWGRPWRLRFLADCMHLFPELQGKEALPLDSRQNEVEIEVEELLPGSTQVRCAPAALFFLDRCGGPVICEPLEPQQALDILARDLIADIPETMEKHRHTWLKLAQRGSYVLRYGKDLDSVVHLLSRFLDAKTAERPVP